MSLPQWLEKEGRKHPDFEMEPDKESGSYYNLQKMNQLHHEIVRRIVMGQKDKEIADSLGCTTATVKYTRESPVVQRKLEIMMGARDASAIEVRNRIAEMAPLALFKIEELLEKENISESVRLKAAQDILDRAGYDPVKKTLDVGKFQTEKINEIKERARANGLMVEEDDVEEAEYTDIPRDEDTESERNSPSDE